MTAARIFGDLKIERITTDPTKTTEVIIAKSMTVVHQEIVKIARIIHLTQIEFIVNPGIKGTKTFKIEVVKMTICNEISTVNGHSLLTRSQSIFLILQ